MFRIRIRRIIHYPIVSGSGGYFYIRIRQYPESLDIGIYWTAAGIDQKHMNLALESQNGPVLPSLNRVL